MKKEWLDDDQGITPEEKEVELIDLVDSSGKIVQYGVPRSEADLYPDLHVQIVIGVIFDKEGRILVQKRAQTKKVDPGSIDHVCGVIKSGETPEKAAVREAGEETGIEPCDIKIIRQEVNTYNRYRTLFVGESDDEPEQGDPKEVEWVCFIHPDELRDKFDSGEFTFVDEFFEDMEFALAHKTVRHPSKNS